MEKLFPIPLYSFLKIAGQNGGISYKRLSNVTPWVFKITLIEPLRWIELITKRNLTRKHIITKPPIFILGYYRSGTTFLQQLFKQDDRFGFTSAFQMIFPEIMLSSENWLTPVFERTNKIFRIYNHIHRIPFTFHSTGEEDVAMSLLFKKYGAQWGYLFPGKMNEYFQNNVMFENAGETEIQEWKTDYMILLKKISLANNCKQLVLKNPPNTGRIRFLLSMFPEAKLIFIRRNPYELFASNKRLWEVVLKKYSIGKDKNINIQEIILTTYSIMMDHYLKDRTMIENNNLVEISYEDLIANPVKTMRLVYDHLNLNDFGYCKPAITRFSEMQMNYKRLDHDLSREESDLVTKKWGIYIEKFGYKTYSFS